VEKSEVKGGTMKKILVVLTLLVVATNFTGCGKQAETVTQEQTKIVKFDSNPQGADVFVDNRIIGQTPTEYKLSIGTHNILIRKTGFNDYNETLNVSNDKKEQEVVVELKKELLRFGETIRFIDKPAIDISGDCPNLNFSGSGIYLNDVYEISGYTVLDSFDIVFPSGKKVHFDTEPTNEKDEGGKEIRQFAQKVTFDEIGEYKVMHNGEIVTPSVGGGTEYKFKVLYKAKILNGTTLGSLNGNHKDDKTVLLPIGESLNLGLLLTDANGNIAKNKLIGLGDLKTDNNGIVTIKVETDVTKESPFVVYGDVICWTCEYTTFDTNGNFVKACFMQPDNKGNLVESVPPGIPKKINIMKENGHIYVPFNCSGLSLRDLGFQGNVYLLFVHPKNPSVIYTNWSVSKDGGKTFENFGGGLSFHAMAIDPNHPEVVYGWIPQADSSSVIHGLVKSKDYGMHFTKIADFEVVMSIVVDPKNSNKIYVTTNDAILRTTNGGKNWETFFTCEAIPWINPHNTDVILTKGCNFAGTKDGGKTWDNLNFFKDRPREWNEPVAFAFDPVNPDVVYGITYSHIFKSEDNGSSWAMPTSRYFFNLWGIAIDQTNPGKIYLDCTDGILVSEDSGKTFANLVSPFSYTGTDFANFLSVDSTGSVYVVLAGIPLKMNAGENWLPLNSNFIQSGPQWAIANGVFYVDIKTIKSDTVVVDINDNNITFYRLYYMGP
jgi:hypothetical protein